MNAKPTSQRSSYTLMDMNENVHAQQVHLRDQGSGSNSFGQYNANLMGPQSMTPALAARPANAQT